MDPKTDDHLIAVLFDERTQKEDEIISSCSDDDFEFRRL